MPIRRSPVGSAGHKEKKKSANSFGKKRKRMVDGWRGKAKLLEISQLRSGTNGSAGRKR